MKKTSIKSALVLSLSLLFNNALASKITDKQHDEHREKIQKTHTGHCVLKQPQQSKRSHVYAQTNIIKTTDYKPFSKKISVYGLTFVAQNDVSDQFMLDVAKTMQKMFVRTASTNKKAQTALLQNLYQYNAVLPIYKAGTEDKLSAKQQLELMSLKEKNSMCDIIIEGSPKQTLEVVEHILHAVTDIGLHYLNPKKWGLNKKSTLYKNMQQAISKNYYNISKYDEFKENKTIYHAAIMQEFAYWLISSYWNIQEKYGLGEDEWILVNKQKLQRFLPKGYQLVNNTIPNVMSVPSKKTLENFNKKSKHKVPK